MEVNYFQLNRAEYYVPLMVKIPGSELALARRGGAEHTRDRVHRRNQGRFRHDDPEHPRPRGYQAHGETAAELAKKPIEYDAGYTLLPGTYTIKVLARDDETGRIGTYMHKFVIPNLNKEEKRIPISSVVLSSQRLRSCAQRSTPPERDKRPTGQSAGAGRHEADSQRDARVQQEPRHVCLSAGV